MRRTAPASPSALGGRRRLGSGFYAGVQIRSAASPGSISLLGLDVRRPVSLSAYRRDFGGSWSGRDSGLPARRLRRGATWTTPTPRPPPRSCDKNRRARSPNASPPWGLGRCRAGPGAGSTPPRAGRPSRSRGGKPRPTSGGSGDFLRPRRRLRARPRERERRGRDLASPLRRPRLLRATRPIR